MIKILEGLTLQFQCLHDCDLPRVVFVTRRSGNLNLLYSNHLPSSGIQRQVDATEIALPNELTPNPFEDGCEDG
jgi:hypothetical protein